MRKFKARPGTTIWNGEGYFPVKRGTIVRADVGKAGLLAVPARAGGHVGLVAMEDLVGFPVFMRGNKAKTGPGVAPAPRVHSGAGKAAP